MMFENVSSQRNKQLQDERDEMRQGARGSGWNTNYDDLLLDDDRSDECTTVKQRNVAHVMPQQIVGSLAAELASATGGGEVQNEGCELDSTEQEVLIMIWFNNKD